MQFCGMLAYISGSNKIDKEGKIYGGNYVCIYVVET